MDIHERRAEFVGLFRKFVVEFLTIEEGELHFARYDECRKRGRANFTAIEETARRGEDTTDAVLRLLLPYTDSAAHRQSGVWIHIAPAIQGDVKEWFQQAHWTKSEDWPKVAKAILNFVSTCSRDPGALPGACREFSSLPYSTGLQTGLLTPILNALRPEEFIIINNKSRRVLNYFTLNAFKQRLTDYPGANGAGLAFISAEAETMLHAGAGDARPADLFDMFSHWLVALKKYPALGTPAERRVRAADRDVIISVPGDENDAPSPKQPIEDEESEPRESHRVQAVVARIGAEMGFRIWIPRNDRQKVLSQIPETVHRAFLDILPLNYDDATLKTIEQIDVIWLRNRSMARAFEVEHTTAIYSGLLRMADLLALQPNMDIRLHIVAPDEKREKVLREIKRPVFSLLDKGPLYERCSFIPYSAIEQLGSLQHLAHMSDSIIQEYEENPEESSWD